MGYLNVAAEVRLETIDCCNCGVVFAMPASRMSTFRERGGSFYCPNGHPQSFTETENMRLRKQLEAKGKEVEEHRRRRGFAENEAAAEKRAREAAEKREGKLKRRVKAGVCPCCKRTFQQLSRHMAGKHPDYNPEAV